MLYLDTSLLVAALVNETETQRMQSWLGEQDVDELAISVWVATEFSSALSVKLRTGPIGVAHRADALALFNPSVQTQSGDSAGDGDKWRHQNPAAT
jgi:predicted nucleic acid-binding protein